MIFWNIGIPINIHKYINCITEEIVNHKPLNKTYKNSIIIRYFLKYFNSQYIISRTIQHHNTHLVYYAKTINRIKDTIQPYI